MVDRIMSATNVLSGDAPCTVEVITTSAGLADLQPVWDRLVSESALTHPFLTHEWISTWCECFGADAQLCILLILACGVPIAIAPLIRRTQRIYGRRVRTIQFPANDHTNRCDVIVTTRAKDAYSAIWKFLMSESALWDAVVLRELAVDTPTLQELSRRADEDGVLWGRWQSEFSPSASCGTDWKHYLENLPAKHRANLRNRWKRLCALGSIGFETISGGPALQDALEDGFRIEGAAWKEREGTAIRCQADVHRFYTLFAERASERGWLRLQFLKVNDRRIAFAYCIAYQNRMHVLRVGFDPAYASYSPVNLLCLHALKDAFACGYDAYEFLGANESWKRQWSTQTLDHGWLFLFPPRPWGRLAHYAKFQLLPGLREFARRSRDQISAEHPHAS
jgi:CelD/BcsL family acetyltransferase involved in cellulose biosynthesis